VARGIRNADFTLNLECEFVDFGQARREVRVMLRVLYRWEVDPEGAAEFVAAWGRATRIVRSSKPGSRGSTLMRNQSDPRTYVALAEWTSLEAWQAFYASPVVDPEASATIKKHSTFLGYELLDLCTDLLIHESETAEG
jgi:heme-degrading monooxygenase HmoA